MYTPGRPKALGLDLSAPGYKEAAECGCVLQHDLGWATMLLCPLHAAAPRLLELLEQAVPKGPTGYKFCRFCNTPDTSNGHYPDCLYVEARAAIAEAKGE